MSELKTYDTVMTPSEDGHWVLKSEADREIRRLKRALYKALANWAHEAKFDYDDEFSRWDNMEQKCLIKVEELK